MVSFAGYCLYACDIVPVIVFSFFFFYFGLWIHGFTGVWDWIIPVHSIVICDFRATLIYSHFKPSIGIVQ